MIYSNRKEIEMKNANQINVNQINNINIKETVYMKKKEFIKNNIDQKQNNSFLVKRDNNINNYVLLEITHKKSKANKNIVEMKAKNLNDSLNIKQNKLILRSNNENINNNNKNENISNNINIRNLNIVTKNEIKKINYNNIKEEKKENKIEKDNKKENKPEKGSKKEIIQNDKSSKINTKNDKEDEIKNEKEEKNYKRIHILLSSSISKEKKAQRGLKNRDNIKLLYTYANNSNENNINKERKNSSN